MDQKIYSYMLSIGLRPKCSGYKYIFDLVKIQTRGTEILPLKLNGYVVLSKKYGKTTVQIIIQIEVMTVVMTENLKILFKVIGHLSLQYR